VSICARLIRLIVGAAADELEERIDKGRGLEEELDARLEQRKSQAAGAAAHQASKRVDKER
jgi:hypothetical protein